LNPDGSITDGADFGRVKRTRDPRQVQFALKLAFLAQAQSEKISEGATRESRASARLRKEFRKDTDGREETCTTVLRNAEGWIQGEVMYEALQKEIAIYEKRTPKSAAAHKRALERIPLGVASNYRHYEPYPIFVKDGKRGGFMTLMEMNTSITTCVSER